MKKTSSTQAQWRAAVPGVSRLCATSLLCFIFALGVRGQDRPDAKKPATVTFESFLRNPPVIANAEFEMRLPRPSSQMIDMLKQTAEKNNSPPPSDSFIITPGLVYCSIKYDGGSFMLNRDGSYGGRFGHLEWLITGDGLRLFSTNSNPPDYSSSMLIKMAATPVRRIVNLGIEEMEPGTASWVEGSDHFTARVCHESLSTGRNTSGIIDVQLTRSNGLPEKAVVTQPGPEAKDETVISYKYDPAFFDGRLPVEFTTSKPLRGANTLKISIKKLEISPSALGDAELDPRKALKEKYREIF
jgi:hypothetical protein